MVYRARQQKLNRIVALKMLIRGAYAGSQELARFRREAEAVALLRHPHIVQVHDVGETSGRPYFTLEFVEGGTLAQQLSGSPQAARRAAELVAILAGAVQFAHQSGIVHRDLQPANILLTIDGAPKIADFGLARSIERGREITLTGMRIGTPCYMAPEQAIGKPDEIGPGVDIYALGVILYEVLTGTPPFVADSAAETERQVIGDEPIPPSRRNPKVPRDLETICLKCLQKNFTRRYASAQDLADDLHRFLDGKPVLARPASGIERAIKWARRSPAPATLVVALFIGASGVVGTAIWIRQQENTRQSENGRREERARQAIESAIDQVYLSGRAERWQEARLILGEAANHLPNANSDELRRKVDQVQADLKFVENLEQIRQTAVASQMGSYGIYPLEVIRADKLSAAFEQAEFDVTGAPEELAERIRQSPFREQIVAAIDEWAYAAFRLNENLLKNTNDDLLQTKLTKIARLADPDPEWRDRFRDPDVWSDKDKTRLLRLADESVKVRKPPPAQLLAIASEVLGNMTERRKERQLLREALRLFPGDFWLNWEMAVALSRDKKLAESATYFRIVNALRPNNPWTLNRLGTILGQAGDYEGGLSEFRRAIELDPQNTIIHHNLVATLFNAGRRKEADAECLKMFASHPNDLWANRTMGRNRFSQFRFEEAIPFYRKAISLESNQPSLHIDLGIALANVGRHEESLPAFRKTIELEPSSIGAHEGLGQSLMKLRRYDAAIREFEWVIREFDPGKKRPNVDLGDGLDSRYIRSRIALSEALLCQGRITEATAAAQHALETPRVDETQRKTVQRYLVLCQQLAPFEGRLPAILDRKEQPPAELPARVALAEWAMVHGHRAAAAVWLYELVFQTNPESASDLGSKNRLHAACAAAMAAAGGQEGIPRDMQQRVESCGKALVWLRADYDVWNQRFHAGALVDQTIAAAAAREMAQNPFLSEIREPNRVSQYPETVRADCERLWTEINDLALRDPLKLLASARQSVAKAQWTRAAEEYARIVNNLPRMDSEIWFEFAAVHLLSKNLEGYRTTCQQMLEAAGSKAPKIRPFLAARAVILSPDSVEDWVVPLRVGSPELQGSAAAFWSLTVQGSLSYRAGRYEEAVRLFERSLKADERLGPGAVNRLWLAMANHRLGNADEARKQFERASSWLDSLKSDIPANADALGLHRHIWLEALFLRAEAESVIRSHAPLPTGSQP